MTAIITVAVVVVGVVITRRRFHTGRDQEREPARATPG
jgi:hypothetical protein